MRKALHVEASEEEISDDGASSDGDASKNPTTPAFTINVRRASDVSVQPPTPSLQLGSRLSPTSAVPSTKKVDLKAIPIRRGAVKGGIEIPVISPAGPAGVSGVLCSAFDGLEITPRQRLLEMQKRKSKAEMAGTFCDFIARMNPDSPLDRRLCVGAKDARRSIGVAAIDGSRELGFRMAVSAVQRERVLSEIMEVITKFKKSCADPAWKWGGLKDFQKLVTKLRNYKAEYNCLDTEVAMWQFRRRLLNAAAPEPSEVFEERRDRLKGFWSQYHASSRKIEVFRSTSAFSPCLDRTSSVGSLSKKMNTSGQIWPYNNKRTAGNANMNSGNNAIERSTSLPAIATTSQSRFVGQTPYQQRSHQRSLSCNRLRVKSSAEEDVELPPISPESPTRRYMRTCQDNRIVPTLLPFVTGHSLKFKAGQKTLVDNDLIAVTVMLPSMEQIEEVDLAGNGLLTERSMVPFMENLAMNPAIATLRRFDLSQCRQVGQGSLQLLVSLLLPKEDAPNASKLQHLDLSGVAISTRVLLPLCKAVRLHKTLKSVNMCDIGLGKSGSTSRFIDDLLGSSSIEELDLGWNSFGPEEFEHLGQRLAAMQKLVTLKLANCSVASNYAGNIPIICPIVFLIEQLSLNRTLKFLDISLNRIDFRAALMLEDALGNHGTLRELNISNNPLGVIGMRSLLRLLSRSESGLTHFICDSCSTGSKADCSVDRAQIFSRSNPGGRYKLDLVRPYHRTLLRMLYKTCEHFGVSPADAFLDMSFSSPPYQHPAKNAKQIWPVRTDGKLTVTFSLERCLETALKRIPDGSFKEFLRSRDELMRLKPAFHKTVPLFAQWKEMNGLEMEQKVFLAALSKDFLVTYPQLESLARSSRQLTSEIITELLPCVIGGEGCRYLALLLTPSLSEYINNHGKLANLLDFSAENPTGPYKLDLGKNADYVIGESLFLLDRWEVTVGRRLQRKDVSQRGNRSHIRNPRFQDRPLDMNGITSVAEWNMPESDTLEFDYVSSKRPDARAKVLDEVTFNKILAVLQSSDCKPATLVGVLRQVSEHFHLRSLQLRSLLGAFLESWDRAEVFVIFFMRVVDMYNEKVFRVRFEDPDDLVKLNARLGYVTSFAFIQPEQSTFNLNFKYHDERVTANILLHLRAKESMHNLRNPKFVLEDGTEDPLPLGVPRAWETFEKMPTSGIFTCSYNCAPEERCFAERRKFMHEYGFWQVDVPEDKIMWWSALTEAPTDVLEFLEFIVGHFKDVYQAFTAIDGEGGNGVLTLREFEEGVATMKCKKFQGPDEQRRVQAIFRYLDPSGEGEVSKDEWGVMEQLWKEMQLSIKEFVKFLKNQFDVDDTSDSESDFDGDKDFLDIAFEYLDDDGSGEIDENEWQEAVRKRLKYFGPCACIFGFLDKDDEGNISIDEFRALRQFDEADIAETPRPLSSPRLRIPGVNSLKP